MDRIEAIREYIPGCAISTDIICGFSTETDDDHNDTLSLMEWAKFDYAYMFKYSERPGTAAAGKYKDDVPEVVKSKRLQEVIELQQKLSHESNKQDVGNTFELLAEGVSRKSKDFLSGRNSQNKVIIFPKKNFKAGDYVNVKVIRCTPATLIGEDI
jgi:tRNA-2-methylthio-N6-dimethylallyladenosine synthase